MLQIKNLTYNAWGREFLDDASVSLPPGSKVGLVGRNGIGKSTLFKLILGELHAAGDEISLPKTARIGSVDQEHPATPVSVIDTILEADVERSAEVDDFFHHVALLVDIDRVDRAVPALVLVLGDRAPEALAEAADAGREDVREADQQRHVQAATAQIERQVVEIDAGPAVAAWPDLDATLLVDRDEPGAPRVNVVELDRILDGPAPHGSPHV